MIDMKVEAILHSAHLGSAGRVLNKQVIITQDKKGVKRTAQLGEVMRC